MEEDVEIDMLLQSTQDMFEESDSNGSQVNSENSECDDFMVQTQKSTKNGFEILISDNERPAAKNLKRKRYRKRTNFSCGKQKKKKSCVVENKKNERFKSFNKDQQIYDDEVISQKAEEIQRHVYSQEILSGSESDNNDTQRDSRGFINELTADDELPYRGSFIEEIRQQVGNKGKKQPKDGVVTELNSAQRLLLEKDDLLRNLERKLQEYIADNKEKQNQIQEAIATMTQNDAIRSTVRQPSFTRNFYKKFGMPYFEDAKGFTCAPNEDVIKKFTEKQLNLLSVPKVYFWSKPHNDILIDCIRNTLVEEHTERLTREIFKLNEALERKENVEETAKKIEELQQNIRDVRKESYSSLVSKEDPDREYDWMKYSATFLDGIHSGDECRRFWHTYLKPSINKSKWTAEEDLKLVELVEQNYGQDWDKIARALRTGRTPFQCFIHYQTRIDINHQYSTGKWTKEEDDSLMKIVNISRHGDYIPWTKVAAHFPNRSHYQVYTRWKNCLNPKLVKGRFSKEEDVLVVAGLEVFGANYSELASLMGNRSVCQIRDRYERHLLPKTSKIGTWTFKEDSELLRLVELHGKRWVVVSKHMVTRSRTQVRQRYNTIQNMMKMRPGWTIEKSRRVNSTVDLGKSLKTTWKIVDKIRKEVDAVEQSFNLSTLEKETFRLEKLKELKDSIMLKKFNVKPKKKGSVEKFEMTNRLIEYFKSSYSSPLIKPSLKPCDKLNYQPFLNQMVLNARNLGFELDLPTSVKVVASNPWLNSHVKFILKEHIKNNEKVKEVLPEAEAEDVTESIDYIPPANDDTIVVKEWWFSSPIDISALNFSELFKRTVFDYSNGMHRDIWFSKMNRVANSRPDVNYLDFNQPRPVSPILFPPSFLTALTLRTAIFSRSRLKKEVAGKGLSKKVKVQPFEIADQGDSNEAGYVRDEQIISNVEPSECEITKKNESIFIQYNSLFNQTVEIVCTWSKYLALVHINNTNYSKTYSLNGRDDGKYAVSKVLTLINEQNELSDDEPPGIPSHAGDTVKNVYKRNFGTRKRAANKKGNKCTRKVKIEHLVKVKKEPKGQLHIPRRGKIKKSKIGLQPKQHSIDKMLRNKKKTCNPDEVIDLENCENLSVMIPENTYEKKTEPNTPSCSATGKNPKRKGR